MKDCIVRAVGVPVISCIFAMAAQALSHQDRGVGEPLDPKHFDRMVIFGDSLSDTGNLHRLDFGLIPKSPPYFSGRFSNGRVWIETLYQKLNIPESRVANYAFGGAHVVRDWSPIPSFEKQVDQYAVWNSGIAPNTLHVVWIGANDFFHNKIENEAQLLERVTRTLDCKMEKLLDIGARLFLMPALPALELAPETILDDEHNGDHRISTRFTNLSQGYNARLAELIEKYKQKYPDAEFIVFDTYGFLMAAIDSAGHGGFNYTKERCNPNSYTGSSLQICPNPEEYVFWDGVHPTARAHQVLAAKMYEAVLAAGYQPNSTAHLLTALADQDDPVSVRNRQAIDALTAEKVDPAALKGRI
jgi:outer membrane lipase/esterase